MLNKNSEILIKPSKRGLGLIALLLNLPLLLGGFMGWEKFWASNFYIAAFGSFAMSVFWSIFLYRSLKISKDSFTRYWFSWSGKQSETIRFSEIKSFKNGNPVRLHYCDGREFHINWGTYRISDWKLISKTIKSLDLIETK